MAGRDKKSTSSGQKSWLGIVLFLSSLLLAFYLSTLIFENSMHSQITAIKVHGGPFSTNTRRVLAAAYEKDLEVELVPVDLASGAHKQPPFLSLNPFGKIPAIEEGDVKLFESRAITKYIAYKYEGKGTQLLVKDKKQKATMEVWSEVEAHQFDPVASKLVWEQHYKKIFKQETDEVVVKENEAKLAKVLDVYEAHLSKSKYLVGDSFTLADLHHLPNLQWLLGTPTMKLFEERPHVHAWCKDILARPAWTKILALQKH